MHCTVQYIGWVDLYQQRTLVNIVTFYICSRQEQVQQYTMQIAEYLKRGRTFVAICWGQGAMLCIDWVDLQQEHKYSHILFLQTVGISSTNLHRAEYLSRGRKSEAICLSPGLCSVQSGSFYCNTININFYILTVPWKGKFNKTPQS